MSSSASGGVPNAGDAVTAAEVLRRQDDTHALSLLLAQRRMYSRAKIWNYIRVIGIGVIALGAPIITAIQPSAAEIVGAIAGAWIFLARTIFLALERAWSRPAANVQDAFDTYIFNLPSNPAIPSESERIADVLRDDDIEDHVRKAQVLGWYALKPDLPLVPATAIAQQSNLAYTQRLLTRHANVWLEIGMGWGIAAVCIGLRLTLAQFLMGIVLPVLPAVLDARDLWDSARSAANDRVRLSEVIAQRIRAWPSHPIKREELRNWQDQLFTLRRDGPLVPDFLYHWSRSNNERAMSARTLDLSQSVRANIRNESNLE
jgi:hypothetical protein